MARCPPGQPCLQTTPHLDFAGTRDTGSFPYSHSFYPVLSKMTCYHPVPFGVVLPCPQPLSQLRACWARVRESQHPRGQPDTHHRGELGRSPAPSPQGGSRGKCAGLTAPRVPSRVAGHLPVNWLGGEASVGFFPFLSPTRNHLPNKLLALESVCPSLPLGDPSQDSIYTARNRCSVTKWQ